MLLACYVVLLLLQITQVLGEEETTVFESYQEYETIYEASIEPIPLEQLSEVIEPKPAITVPPSSTTWPQYVPPGPFFFDTECFGKFQQSCSKASPFCTWYTLYDPTCYDRRFVSVTIPPVQQENRVPLHVKFFQFNYGVHLVEGTFFKRFYSTSVDECAALCLQSAGGFSSNKQEKIRCLSFDFYPFEVWEGQAPYNEAKDKGICTLNSETKDTARMRNEDQGLTDAELFYKSHCSRRPFSQYDGYYEVRDPRGTLTPLLQYAGPESLGLEAPWGGSRWGMFHPNLPGYIPTPLNKSLTCSIESSSDEVVAPTFRGGFTPIDDEQHCPGLMTKSEARTLCQSRGGDLCSDQADLNAISGRKLGCSFDQSGNGLIWHNLIPDRGQRMYPRCCASYQLPLSNSRGTPLKDSCLPYQTHNLNFCNQFKTVTECDYSHNPYDPQSRFRPSWLGGFGHELDDIRAECLRRSQLLPGYNCSQMDLGPWKTITNCIWCPQAGLYPIGGNGECRPGGSYGICPSASEEQRTVFGLRVRSTCSDQVNCDLINKYPDLRPFMGNYTVIPTTRSPVSQPATRTNNPTDYPTKRPTTRKPTRTSKQPTQKMASVGVPNFGRL